MKFLKIIAFCEVKVDSTLIRIVLSSLLDFKTFNTKNQPSLPLKKVNSTQPMTYV